MIKEDGAFYAPAFMFATLIRTIIMYSFIMGLLRFMGKRQIGELHPSELVVTIMVSEIAAMPIIEPGRSISITMLAVLTLVISEVAISFIALKSNKARRFIYGAPSMLYEKGKINKQEMLKQRFNINDLNEEMRNQGYTGLSELDYVIIETNGRVSLIPNAENKPVSAKDMNLQVVPAELSHLIISDGVVDAQNIKKLGFDGNWLNKKLSEQHCKNPKDIFYMSATKAGDVFILKNEV